MSAGWFVGLGTDFRFITYGLKTVPFKNLGFASVCRPSPFEDGGLVASEVAMGRVWVLTGEGF